MSTKVPIELTSILKRSKVKKKKKMAQLMRLSATMTVDMSHHAKHLGRTVLCCVEHRAPHAVLIARVNPRRRLDDLVHIDDLGDEVVELARKASRHVFGFGFFE